MKTSLLKPLVLAAFAGLLLAGCGDHGRPSAPTQAQSEEYVSEPPPPPFEVDVQTACPGPDYIWIGGAWDWGPGGRWVWERGHWDRPPHPGAVWEPHRYDTHNGRHVFTRGRWK